MGLVGFIDRSEGETAEIAFATAVQCAKLMNGVGGYQAEIHKKTRLIVIVDLPRWILDPTLNVLFKVLSLAEDIETQRVMDDEDGRRPLSYDREEYFAEYLDHAKFISTSGTDEERYAGERYADDLHRHLERFVEVIGLERLFMILDWRASDDICLAVEASERRWIFFGASDRAKTNYHRGGRSFG